MKAEQISIGKVEETLLSSGIQLDEGPPCAAKVEQIFAISAHALLSKVVVSILAMPAGECLLSEAGETRLSQEDKKKVVIDLKRMRSVAGLKAPQTIEKIDIWTGASFSDNNTTLNKKNVFFSEIATERLLVTFASEAKMADLVGTGTLFLPDAPADLVLSVNDKTAWTHLGPVQLAPTDFQPSKGTVVLDAKAKEKLLKALSDALNDILDGGHSEKEFFNILEDYGIILSAAAKTALKAALKKGSKSTLGRTEQALEEWLVAQGVTWEGQNTVTTAAFTETIDITQLLQDEINAGASALKIVLRAALACRLQLTLPPPEYLLSHEVVFPAQALALEIPEECRTTLSLPLPPASNSWLISTIFFTLEGNAGRSRYFPAVGPEASLLGELALDGDHALAALLTQEFLARFKNIEGLRLPLLVDEGGAEVTAFLRLDEGGKVGAYLEETAFRSQTLEPSQEEQWVLLELGKAVDVQPGASLWVELNVIRGKCWWPLGGDGAADGVVTLQRGLPGGSFAVFAVTLNRQSRDLQGRLRLKGQPVTDGAIPAIRPLDPQSEEELQGITTGSAPLAVELAFENAVRPGAGKLDVPMIFHAPGTYTVTKARVIYEE